MKNLNVFILGVIGLVAVGCSSTPGAKIDSTAAVRSKAYLEGVSTAPAEPKFSEKASCTTPKEFEKSFASHQGDGPSKNWKKLITHANGCVIEKKWIVLEDIANTMGRIDLDSPWAPYYLSVAAEGSGEYTRALWMIDLAQKKAGGKAGLYSYQKARVLLKMNQTAKAVNEFQQAVSQDNGLTDAHLYLGEIHHRDMDLDQAAKHYKAVLSAEPSHYQALVGLAEIRLEKGAPTEALDLFTKANSSHPLQLHPWIRLAYLYESVQKNAELALNTYKSLKAKVESGSLKERPEFDLNDRIKKLEESVKAARLPAQAAAPKKEEPRSVK